MTSLSLRLVIISVLALALTILPLPYLLASFRPPWVLLFALYLQFFLPQYFNIFILLILGLILDSLSASVIGEHTFALTLVALIANNKVRRFKFFLMGQQMILIGLFCLTYQLIILSIDAFLGYSVPWVMAFSSTLTTMLFWPWIMLVGKNRLSLNL